jgi:hypothetical protein
VAGSSTSPSRDGGLDTTDVKANEGASVVSKAIFVATGVTAKGDREVFGFAIGDSKEDAFWTAFSALGPGPWPRRRLPHHV